MTPKQIQKICRKHREWLESDGFEGQRANLLNANLQGIKLNHANLEKAFLRGADFTGSELIGVNFQQAELSEACFSKANLSNANFWKAKLTKADFSFSLCMKTNFEETDLLRADFYNATLTDAFFAKSILNRADFQYANLTNSLFVEADTKDANFKEANVSKAVYLEADVSKNYIEVISNFVPTDLLSYFEKSDTSKIRLGDHTQKKMSVLFADIRGFTKLISEMNTNDSFRFLNNYLREIIPCIKKNEGAIDKFMGDCIMAIFENTNHAIQSGIDMLNKLKEYNAGRNRANYNEINIGIGIHTGELTLGVIGDENHMNVTAISNTVNTASRISELTKKYSTPLLISKDTHFDSKLFKTRFIGIETLRGHTEKTIVLEIFDADPPDLQNKKEKTLKPFEQGWKKFYLKNFEEALVLFQQCYKENEADLVAKMYVEECGKKLKAFTVFEKGVKYFIEKKYKTALECFEDYLKIAPEGPAIEGYIHRCKMKLKNNNSK